MATSVPSSPLRSFANLARNSTAAAKTNTPEEDDLDDAVDEDDDDEDDDGETDENGKPKKSKKTKKAKDKEDKCDDEDEDKPDARTVRRREKARIRTILNSAAGKLLPTAARNLALNTAMPRHAAVRLLRKMVADLPPQSRDSLRDRMAGVYSPDVGAGDTLPNANEDPAKALAAKIIAAGRKARGEAV